jgi:radical SAM superfamily enzyme YgiQ (UPF0313 family)
MTYNKTIKREDIQANGFNPDKILLVMLPFWTPLVPPQGICHLKNFLQHHGFIVKTKDANIAEEFKELYNQYFDVLRKYVPENKRGNFFNIGHDVMRNHLIAHTRHNDEEEYNELVKILIYNTYYTLFSDPQISELNDVLTEFYKRQDWYIHDLLAQEKPGVLGISVPRDSVGPVIRAFQITKEKYPFITTVMGGSIFSDHLLKGTPNLDSFLEKTPYIDKIIIGEGQSLFLKLMRDELPESQRVFTSKEDGVTLGFTSLNFPDMTDFNLPQDYPYLSAQASTSCPNQCSFCNVSTFWGKYREKDPKQTVEEMTFLYKQYGRQLFFMNDALLNQVADSLSDEFLKSDIALYWDGYLKVDDPVCDFENTIKWRRGGFYRARLGVESGSQHVLDLIHKGITPTQIKTALISLATAGIKTTAYWVIGHPGETEDDFVQTLELLEEIKDYIYEAECNPFIYGYGGQADTSVWKDKRKPLYPEKADDMLILKSWIVDDAPSREEVYLRVNRFVQQCGKLGIPNPYSLHDIYKADKRWQKLHKNAVPPLAEINLAYTDECKKIKNFAFIKNKIEEDGEFSF